MMNEKQLGDRITVLHIARGIAVQVKSKKQISLLFLPVWITVWTIGGVTAIKALLTGQAPGFLIFWLCGWVVGETLAVYTFLWTAFGKEVISVDQGILTIKKDLFGYGFKKELPIHELNNLRTSAPFGSTWSNRQWGISGGTVAVDQNYKTHRFGISLEEPEARALVKELRSYLPKSEAPE